MLEIFISWFEQNKQKLPFPVKLNPLNEGSFELRFEGQDKLSVYFGANGQIVVVVTYIQKVWDLITDFDIDEIKSEDGYYCGFCTDRTVYSSREELWQKHAFEPLWEWIIENISEEKYLCLYQTDNQGSTWAKILDNNEVDDDQGKEFRVLSELLSSKFK